MRNSSFPQFFILSITLLCSIKNCIAQGSAADYERSNRVWEKVNNQVFPRDIRTHWIEGSDLLWYQCERTLGHFDYLLVNTQNGEVTPAFDRIKLSAALGQKISRDIAEHELRLEELRYEKADSTWQFNFGGKGFRWNDSDGSLTEIEPIASNNRERRRGWRRNREHTTSQPGNRSPDGQWEVRAENHNLTLVKLADGSTQPVTADGVAEHHYEGMIFWSPDSRKFIAIKTTAAEPHPIHIIESSPKDQLQPKLRTIEYHKPGDKIAVRKPCLFSIEPVTAIPVADTHFPTPWSIEDFRWEKDSQRFTFLYNQRGHQVVRIIAIDAQTGATNIVVDESSPTFVDYAHKLYSYYINDRDEVIWMSERNGWNHLYRINLKTGEVLNPITHGEWVVRDVEYVDPEKREIWFRASGIYPEQDPYYIHYCRIDFDGQNLVFLTAGDGTHDADFSPDRRFFVDTYSRVDMAPIIELRNATDGKLIKTLEAASLEQLKGTGWQSPERFAAKGRDGKTDIYGVIYRPSTFDSTKSYPILESIYAGPHGSHVPKNFTPFRREMEMAELGFIVVQIDGMGTSNRSKAFHDVCWKNLGDSGFPDRRLWIQAAAAKYPYLDLQRVGLYGGSAGGQSTLRGLLAHGDFYKVGVADCGCHDNRMDKIWWNELWMGYPIGPHYEEQSNVTLAHQLTGKLMLIVGELDENVDPASTMQVVNALVKADKDFELLILPGVGHGAAETPYGHRRRKDFLVRHLLGVEPRHP